MQNTALPIKLQFTHELILDFGPTLAYEEICTAYTVEKFSLYQRMDEMVIIKARGHARARLEGKLYYIPSEEDIIKLDSERGVGVNCDRKYIPILLPYRDDNGEFMQSYANVYLGHKDYWQDRIETDFMRRRINQFVILPGEFDLAPQVSHEERMLNNRRCFNVPPYERKEREVRPLIAHYVGERNAEEMQRLAEMVRDQLLRDQAYREEEARREREASRMGRLWKWMKE